MTVLSAPKTPLNVESEGLVVTPVDEIDQVPVLPVVESVHVPLGLIVRESVSAAPEDCPEDVRKLPSHAPVKSANEQEAACFVKIRSRGEPLDKSVCVHAMTVLPESIWHRILFG
jgi:hypothetical protein